MPHCMYLLQPSVLDDMMERAEWGPDVRLYIGPDKGTGQDTGRGVAYHMHPITYTTSHSDKDYMY